MDDLKTLREEFRADTSMPGAGDLRELRERLVAETRHRPRRFGWLRGLRLPSPRLLVPALAGALTLALVAGVVLVREQGNGVTTAPEQPTELTLPGPNQWLFVESVWFSEQNDPEQAEEGRHEAWVRGDYRASASRSEGGELEREGPFDEPRDIPGGYFETSEELHEFYRAVLDDPIAALDDRVAWLENARCPPYDDLPDDDIVFASARECREYVAEPSIRDALRLGVAATFLGEGAPAAVQTELYDALRNLPTVRIDDIVQDEIDRDNLVISSVEPDFRPLGDDPLPRRQVLFDPETHLFSGTRKENPQGEVTWSNLVIGSGIVDEPGEVP